MPTRSHVLVMLILMGNSTSLTASEPSKLTPREVLDKSKAAMLQPLRYQMRVGGIEQLVYSKQGAGGGMLMRTEVVTPAFEKITIVTGTEHYEWYPKLKVGFDTGQLFEGIIQKAQSVAAQNDPKKASSNVVFLTDVLASGESFYVVEEAYSETTSSAIEKAFAAGGSTPVSQISKIDKGTFLPSEVRTIFKGQTVPPQVVVYDDFALNRELPNELFLPPDGYEFKKITTMTEYTSAMSKLLKRESAPPKQIKPQLLGPITIDPDTGKPLAPLPKGMTRKQFDLLTQANPPAFEEVLHKLGEPQRRRNRLIAIASGLVFATSVLVALIRHTRKRA